MFRKITSLVSFFSIIILSITSVVLYLVPQGRVAYWANWNLLGLSKEQWGDIHICTGVLFLVASILHIWLNWKPIMAYLKKKSGAANFSSPAFFISLIITLYVVIGAVAGVPPMNNILEFSAHLKDQGAVKYGVPPYGHAELSSLGVFCKRMGLDADKAIASLKAAQIAVESPKQSLKELAGKAGITPKELHEIILKDQPGATKKTDSHKKNEATHENDAKAKPAPKNEAHENGAAGMGLGKLTLEQYCERQNIELNTALAILEKEGAVVDKSTPIRDIAGMLDMNSPREIGKLLHP
ncbi:DUF4405 domain-containing protein [Maridesulfovibrio frigidus]|uniref:DUF4405 domain-containing protein n=1 Tax=Maridesulfovibrio frigidus TaxID=340956 RepID=UPI00055160C4|nr:DUF4405 domain-containing protein [Maridesulfovibrio frigidus]